MPKKIFLINSSLLKESDCDCKVDYIHNQGLVTQKAKFEADYGNAFHKFVALYNQGIDPKIAMKAGADYFLEKCLAVPEDDFRTIDHLMMVMLEYIKGPFRREIDILKPLVVNNKHMVELQFSFPYETTEEYDVILTGTTDMLGKYIEGRDIINDYKVTSSWLKDKFLDKYDLDPQLMFYSWVLKTYGVTKTYLPGMITGIFIKRPNSKQRVDGKMVARDTWNGAEFMRSALIEFSEIQIANFEIWLKRKIERIIGCWLHKNYPQNFNRCADFNGCDFRHLCKESDPQIKELKLNSMYDKREYDPSQFQK